MDIRKLTPAQLYGIALVGLSLTSLGFLTVSASLSQASGGFGDWYLVWNLFLAWIPLVLAYILSGFVRQRSWADWPAIGLSLAWLLFLPNSFYIVSDLIHLEDMPRSHVLFDSLMFCLFTFTGLVLGYTSLHLVHSQLRRRITMLQSASFVSLVLLLCSFAIYLGRDLRWNSWDVLVNPAGILFDISERVIDPLAHPQAFTVTTMFFLFLSSLYWAGRAMLRAMALAARRST